MEDKEHRHAAIRAACESIFLEIARLTDQGPQVAIAELFTEDGELDREGSILRGRAALVEMYGKRPANLMTRHLVSNLSVQPQSDREARMHGYATVYRHRSTGAASPVLPVICDGPEAIVEYSDTCVRTDSGWKLSRRVMRTVIEIRNSGRG